MHVARPNSLTPVTPIHNAPRCTLMHLKLDYGNMFQSGSAVVTQRSILIRFISATALCSVFRFATFCNTPPKFPGDTEDIHIHKGCWPSTPTPHAMYKGCGFGGFGLVTSAQVQQLPKPRLNANAQEFVPSVPSMCGLAPPAPPAPPQRSQSHVWDYNECSLPDEQRNPPQSQLVAAYDLSPKVPAALSSMPRMPEKNVPDPVQARGLRTDVPSQGSALHSMGQCKPCAWFWKSRGCSNAAFCDYCHLCPPGALKERKKAKIAAIRAGIIEPRAVLKA